jgi:hypothetical protein
VAKSPTNKGFLCIAAHTQTHTNKWSINIQEIFWFIPFVNYVDCTPNKQTNSVALNPQANYTNWSTATCRRNLVSTFVDRGVSCGQRGESPTVVDLSFLDRSRYFSFK